MKIIQKTFDPTGENVSQSDAINEIYFEAIAYMLSVTPKNEVTMIGIADELDFDIEWIESDDDHEIVLAIRKK